MFNVKQMKIKYDYIYFSEPKAIDLQLPVKKEALKVPILQNDHPAPSQRVFTEKTVKRIASDDEEDAPSTFKKRNFGQKKLRKRFED